MYLRARQRKTTKDYKTAKIMRKAKTCYQRLSPLGTQKTLPAPPARVQRGHVVISSVTECLQRALELHITENRDNVGPAL